MPARLATHGTGLASTMDMLHAVARARPGTLLFRTWAEARALWDRLTLLGPLALVLMPDHLHLVARTLGRRAWNGALSGYARWRNAARGEEGPVFERSPDPRHIPDRLHLERTIRYVHLNPCRARLVPDPLAWPFSTHRDAVGLALRPVRPPEADPHRFHAWVSADPSVAVGGTSLPARALAAPAPEALLGATSALARVPIDRVSRDRVARSVAVHALRRAGLSARAVGGWLELSHGSVLITPVPDHRDLERVERVAGDPRFPALEDGPLPFRPHR